ncbi:MAG: hypothetical protein F6K31_44345 [Symploca sp. SIO2G7]|nr:hypothetical protein [Symploca sp. SIO2G7]
MKSWLKFSLSLLCSGTVFLNPNLVGAQEFERLPELPGIDTSQVQYVRGETVRDRNLERQLNGITLLARCQFHPLQFWED